MAADERVNGDYDSTEMERVIALGLWCVHHDPSARPSIRDCYGHTPIQWRPATGATGQDARADVRAAGGLDVVLKCDAVAVHIDDEWPCYSHLVFLGFVRFNGFEELVFIAQASVLFRVDA
uniref:Uncharacterized protein n=1 Tax=Oryza glumipatula TaxID=40148 RepID=A0A0E0AX41_9ORYZ